MYNMNYAFLKKSYSKILQFILNWYMIMTYLFSIVNMCVLKHYIQMIMKCLKHREQLINCHLNIRQLAYAGRSQNLLSTTYMIKIGAINHGFLNFVSDNLYFFSTNF